MYSPLICMAAMAQSHGTDNYYTVTGTWPSGQAQHHTSVITGLDCVGNAICYNMF
jgi:hypothetical protein